MLKEGQPQDLASLWLWAIAETRAARMIPPDRLHSQSGDRDDWGSLTKSERSRRDRGELTKQEQEEIAGRTRSAIRGLPYTRAFTHYLDGGLSKSMTQALASVRPLKGEQVTRARRQMWRVVHAVVTDGETNTESCRTRLGMDDFAFRSAALNGLLMLRSALEHSV